MLLFFRAKRECNVKWQKNNAETQFRLNLLQFHLTPISTPPLHKRAVKTITMECRILQKLSQVLPGRFISLSIGIWKIVFPV